MEKHQQRQPMTHLYVVDELVVGIERDVVGAVDIAASSICDAVAPIQKINIMKSNLPNVSLTLRTKVSLRLRALLHSCRGFQRRFYNL